MKIEKIKLNEIQKVAELHKKYIPKAFLTTLGIETLKFIYRAFYDSKCVFCFVTKNEENEIVGFVTGCLNLKKFYWQIFNKNLFKLSFFIVPRLIKINILRKIYEILRYSFNRGKELPSAELLSIVIEPGYQGSGASKELFLTIKNEFSRRGINEFKVLVGDENKRACRFYEKIGCRFQTAMELHKGIRSNIYIYSS